MLFFAGFGHYAVAVKARTSSYRVSSSVSSNEVNWTTVRQSKFQLGQSDDITCAVTFAQGSADRVRSVTFTVPHARFHAFA